MINTKRSENVCDLVNWKKERFCPQWTTLRKVYKKDQYMPHELENKAFEAADNKFK